MNLIDQLVDAAYDSGYYSGKKEDGQPHHIAARNHRVALSHELAGKVEALTKEAEWLFRVVGTALDRGIELSYLTLERYEEAREIINVLREIK